MVFLLISLAKKESVLFSYVRWDFSRQKVFNREFQIRSITFEAASFLATHIMIGKRVMSGSLNAADE